MAVPVYTSPSTVPSSGASIASAPLANRINGIHTFLAEGGNFDEANADLISADGLVGKSTNQTLAGVKTFSGGIILQDSVNLTFGTGSDATIDYDGTNLVIDPKVVGSGVLSLQGGLTVGVNDTGYDVQLFGATSGVHLLWDESADTLKLVGGAATNMQGTLTVGVDGTGYDFLQYSASAGAFSLWDQSADKQIIQGATAAGAGSLLLSTGELTVVDGDILGRIDFSAPLESSGTDAILVGASIWAEADDTFGTALNDTDLVFALAESETAIERVRMAWDGTTTNLHFAQVANISSTADITLTAVGDVNIPASIGLTFGDDGEKIEGDGTDLTIASSNLLNLTATTDVAIPANVGLLFGTGEKIEGDSTNLTVTSGAAINLTATTDVVIPANVGITFGTGEKIEGDDTDLTLTSGADIILASTGMVHINDTANTFMTTGLTINQGAADDEIFCLKSSDVAHGMTLHWDTDTYGIIEKQEAVGGGLSLVGIKDADGQNGGALLLQGYLGEAADTTKTTSGIGIIDMVVGVKNGTNHTNPGADANMATIRTRNGECRFIFDVEGSGHADVAWTTYDTYNDLSTIRDMETELLAMEQGDPQQTARREYMERTGVIGEGSWHMEDGKPRAMVNFSKLAMLHHGAHIQTAERLNTLEVDLLERDNKIALLEQRLNLIERN